MESNKIDCRNVYVKESNYSSEGNQFDGAFTKKDFKKGELIEKGLMRRLSDNDNKTFDGMNNQFVFTWSDDIPNYTWAMGSGCSPYYNTNPSDKANTKMTRYFDKDSFEIHATRDIAKDEELTHTYKSLEWRTVFTPLNEKFKKSKA